MAVILDTNAVSALLAGDPALGGILEPQPLRELIVSRDRHFDLVDASLRVAW